MSKTDLTEKQKNNIINECISTRKTFKVIARENNLSLEDVYLMMYEYCEKNGYSSFKRTHKGVVFAEKVHDIENIMLKNAKELEEWCQENHRKPINIKGIKKAENGEEETKEQRETRLAKKMSYIKKEIANKYDGKKLEEIESELDREIVRIIREIDEGYKRLRVIDNKRKERTVYLRNVKEILEWKEVNKKKPKIINGVKAAKKIENETAEQTENRLARALKTIKYKIVKLYDDISLEDIENKDDREIVRIVRELEKEGEREKSEATLNEARKIETWCIENGRRPRALNKVKVAKKGEKETAKQTEKRMSKLYHNIKKYIEKYEGKDLGEIEDKIDREIVTIIRGIEKNIKENVSRKRSLQDSKYLKSAIDIQSWCKENERRPRKLSNIRVAKKGEKETAEQTEKRISNAWWNINNNVIKKYEGISIEDIKDEVDREIVRIMRRICEQYEKNNNWEIVKNTKKKDNAEKELEIKKRKAHFVKTVGNEKMRKMIINLIKTKNATEEQVKVVAGFYGVDMGNIINEKDER